jgi:CO dehydrogenase maturation factor
MSKPDRRLIAICGKGGTGKTALAAMMTKVILDSGQRKKLLLIDADPATGLAIALGVKIKRTIGQIREEVILTAKKGNKREESQMVNMLDYMGFEALNEEDGFTLLAMGRTETLGCFCPVNDLLRDIIEKLSRSFDTIIIDCEAGLEQLNRQIVRSLDTLVVTSDASIRGLQTVSVITNMVENDNVIHCGKIGLVLNRMQSDVNPLKYFSDKSAVELFGSIPQDKNIADYDLSGRSLMELPDTSPALIEVRKITEKCLN